MRVFTSRLCVGDRGQNRGANDGLVQVPDDFLQGKSTAAMGVLKAAERAAAPADTRFLTLVGERRNQRPMTEASPAPMCTEGPSRPSERPAPMQRAPVRNFPTGVRTWITSFGEVIGHLRLRHPAAPRIPEITRQEEARDQACQFRHEHAPKTANRRTETDGNREWPA